MIVRLWRSSHRQRRLLDACFVQKVVWLIRRTKMDVSIHYQPAFSLAVVKLAGDDRIKV
jgi:hypothetical protein